MSSKSNKNKKRNRSEEKEWKWDDTMLKDSNKTPLKADAIKQLLITRGEKKQNIPGKKAEMIEYLKKKHEVALDEEFSELTVKELIAELKLRGLNDLSAKKAILVQRLNGEIDASPPKKKIKRAKKSKLRQTNKKNDGNFSLNVATAENDPIVILGAYKKESKAYEKAMDRLIEDVESYYDHKEDKIDKAMKKFDDMPDKEYKKRMDELTDIVTNAFDGKEEDAPYCDVHQTSIYD